MTQSCDMVHGSEKVTEILLCPLWQRSEITSGHLSTAKGIEDARRGNLPGYHLLAECRLAGFEREVRIVDFRQVHTLPLQFTFASASAWLNSNRPDFVTVTELIGP